MLLPELGVLHNASEWPSSRRRSVALAEEAGSLTSESAGLDDLLVNDATTAEVAAERPPTSCIECPLPVAVTLTVSDVFGFDEKASYFRVQGQVVLSWPDARLEMPRGLQRVQLEKSDVWTPQIDFYNQIGELQTPATKVALLGARGSAQLTKTMRFVGDFATRMNFVYYPGDKHALPIEIELFGNPSSAVAFNSSSVNMIAGAVGSSVWHVDQVRWQVADVVKPSTGLSYNRLVVRLDASREISSSIVNLFMPVLMMMCLSYASFYMDPRVAPARTGLTVTALLCTFTYYGHVSSTLPNAGYFTYTDLFCISSIIGALGALFAYIRVHRLLTLHAHQKPKEGEATVDYLTRAEETDSACRVYFPIYILVCLCLAVPPIVRSGLMVYDDGVIL